ncbi:hypothetical protein ERJ75_000770100 [Trypanosoma vivax]|nr:hypothetical protein ERJ75_000770100 [Trypanosoma vivax]
MLRRLSPSRRTVRVAIAVVVRCHSTLDEKKMDVRDTSEGASIARVNKDLQRSNGFLEPSDDVVLEYARHALRREGRDKQPEAVVWQWETTHPPILARGKQNFYDYTDDIPAHVKPFWHHEYYQQREYFRLQRAKRPLKEQVMILCTVTLCLSLVGGVLTIFRVWVEQPKEVRQLREDLLQQAFGRVLELSAGHGQNIGAYPYAVHEVVMCDSNAQQLEALRYRLPKTSYPKYEVRRVRSESLEVLLTVSLTVLLTCSVFVLFMTPSWHSDRCNAW